MPSSRPISSARGPRAEQRPRGWLTIVRLALAASPARALRGLGWVLRGKRVRGWNMLYVAAADHPEYYQAWVRRGEPRAIEAYRARHPASGTAPSIACLILGGDAVATLRTLDSVRATLGDAVPVWSNCATLDAIGVATVSPDAPLWTVLGEIDPGIQWVLPLHAGDTVAGSLGAVLRHAVPTEPVSAILYWDEDMLRDRRREAPWIKPDFDPLLFAARDGLTGAALIAAITARTAAVEDLRFDFDGVAQLIARIVADAAADPLHIPLVLTHRMPETTPLFAAPDLDRFASMADWPSVSVMIPTRDRADLLETCIAGLDQLDYPGAIELLIIDNDSVEPATLALFARLVDAGASVLPHPGAFNYAALINQAAAAATGDMLCLLNNDVEMRDSAWLTEMVRYAMLDAVGAVGARLLFPDGTIQHAGVAIGIGGAAGHVQKGVDPADPRFAEWHAHSRIVSAVTGACLVVRRASFEAVGGMDAASLAVDFNDVDFCLKLQALGFANVLAVEATLIHQESVSRGSDPAGTARFERELTTLRARWNTIDAEDPHYSPLFRRECQRCVLSF